MNRLKPKRRGEIKLGYVVDPYRGKMRIFQIGEAGEGELAFKISKFGEIGSDWRDRSELRLRFPFQCSPSIDL